MKRLSILLVFFGLCIACHALTVKGLFNKYKKLPDVTYKEINRKELRANIDSVSSESEKEVLRSLKKMEVLMFPAESLPESLVSDLTSLKDYSLIISYSKTEEDMIDKMFNSIPIFGADDNSFIIDVYGRNTASADEYVTQPVIMMRFWEWITLIYLDGRVRLDDTKQMIKVTITPEESE